MNSLILHYTAEARLEGGGNTTEHEGTWVISGDRQAVRQSYRITGKKKRLFHSFWDGRTGRTYGLDDLGKPIDLTIGGARPVEFWAILPDQFGLRHARYSWAEYVRMHSSRAQLIGQELVAGKKCQKLIIRPTVPPDSPAGRPLILWIDTTQTLLVMRAIRYMSVSEVPEWRKEDLEYFKSERIMIDGQEMTPVFSHRVDEVTNLGSFWIPIGGTYIHFVSNTPAGKRAVLVTRTTVDRNTVAVNSAIPEELITPPENVKGVTVFNKTLDTTEYIPPSDGERGPPENQLEDALRSLAESGRVTLGRWLRGGPSFLSLSCGPRCLYASLRLNGRSVSLSNMALDDKSFGDGWSVADMQNAARQCGVQFKALMGEDSDYRSVAGYFIAHVRASTQDEPSQHPTHFVVARVLADGKVQVFSPPGTIAVMSEKDFKAAWTGTLLCTVQAILAPGPILAQEGQVSILIWVALGTGATVILSVLALFMFRKSRWSRTIVVLLVSASAATLTSCDQEDDRITPTPGHNDSGLRVLDTSTVNLGAVAEGFPAVAHFRIQNVTSNIMRVTAKGSCGCTRMTIDPPEMQPSAVGTIAVTVVTSNRGAGINEFVDLYAEGKRIGTCWIVGEVKTILRMQASPASIDLGEVMVGETRRIPVVVKTAISDPSISWTLTVDGPPADDELTWTIRWTKEPPTTTLQGSPRQDFECEVVFSGRKASTTKVSNLIVSAQTSDGARVASALIGITSTVVDGYTVSPRCVLRVFAPVEDEPTFELSILARSKGVVGMPDIVQLPSWLKVEGMRRQGESIIARLRYHGDPREGYDQATIMVKWGSHPTVPVDVVLGRRQ